MRKPRQDGDTKIKANLGHKNWETKTKLGLKMGKPRQNGETKAKLGHKMGKPKQNWDTKIGKPRQNKSTKMGKPRQNCATRTGIPTIYLLHPHATLSVVHLVRALFPTKARFDTPSCLVI